MPAEGKARKEHERKHKKSTSSCKSSMSLPAASSSSKRDSQLSQLEHKAHKARSEPKLSVLQTVKKHYALAVDYRTYCLACRSPRYDDTVSSYIAKLFKKVKSQIKAHFFNLCDRISIIGLLVTFKLAFDTNKIHKGAAMWVLPHDGKKTLSNVHNRRTCAEDRSASLAASMRNKETRPRKLLRSYPELVTYLLEKFATDQAIA